MKILMIQKLGEHVENAKYKPTCFHELNQIPEVEAKLWGPGYPDYNRQNFGKMFQWADAILHMEDRNARWVPGMAGIKKLKILYSMDTHMIGEEHVGYAKAQRFDVFLTAVKGWEALNEGGMKRYWFPNNYPQKLFEDALKDCDYSKEYPVAFLGNTANRMEWINVLRERCGLVHLTGIIGDDMARSLRKIGVSWNRNISGDINARTFEVLGAGSFLLTNHTPGLDELFDCGKHLVTYDSIDDCVDKIKYYSENVDEREAIARAGHDHCKKHHSDKSRAVRLVEIIKENL